MLSFTRKLVAPPSKNKNHFVQFSFVSLTYPLFLSSAVQSLNLQKSFQRNVYVSQYMVFSQFWGKFLFRNAGIARAFLNPLQFCCSLTLSFFTNHSASCSNFKCNILCGTDPRECCTRPSSCALIYFLFQSCSISLGFGLLESVLFTRLKIHLQQYLNIHCYQFIAPHNLNTTTHC